METNHVKVGGAGVRHSTLGASTPKRVTAVNDEVQHRSVPNEVLSELRSTLDRLADNPALVGVPELGPELRRLCALLEPYVL